MKTILATFAVLALAPAVQAAEMNHGDHGSMPMSSMPMHQAADGHDMAQHAAMETVSATGTVKKLDPAKGSITIAHAPVESLGWPAMVMPFKADASLLEGLQVGDAIHFEFIAEGMPRVTRIEKQ